MYMKMWIKECGNTFGENMREIYRKFTSIDEARDWGKKIIHIGYRSINLTES